LADQAWPLSSANAAQPSSMSTFGIGQPSQAVITPVLSMSLLLGGHPGTSSVDVRRASRAPASRKQVVPARCHRHFTLPGDGDPVQPLLTARTPPTPEKRRRPGFGVRPCPAVRRWPRRACHWPLSADRSGQQAVACTGWRPPLGGVGRDDTEARDCEGQRCGSHPVAACWEREQEREPGQQDPVRSRRRDPLHREVHRDDDCPDGGR